MCAARAVLMIPPVEFGYNAQTAADNEFQTADSGQPQAAMAEWQATVHTLQSVGIQVLVPEYEHFAQPTPDAVFPNNWWVSSPQGQVVLCPMRTPNRRQEMARATAVSRAIALAHFELKHQQTLDSECDAALEGTGSMVIDWRSRVPFVALSARSQAQLAKQLAQMLGLKAPICFATRSRSGKPYYHTNVVLAIGHSWAVWCPAALSDSSERALLAQQLAQPERILVEISAQQLEEHYCANILELENAQGQTIIAMSEAAFQGFTPAQRTELSRHGTLLHVPIPTIEGIGGGSMRCMLAEVWLPTTAHHPTHNPSFS